MKGTVKGFLVSVISSVVVVLTLFGLLGVYLQVSTTIHKAEIGANTMIEYVCAETALYEESEV